MTRAQCSSVIIHAFLACIYKVMTILYFYTRFEWDQTKALANETKHGIRFSEAATVWNDARVLTVVYCERQSAVRLISARRAGKREIEQYFGDLV